MLIRAVILVLSTQPFWLIILNRVVRVLLVDSFKVSSLVVPLVGQSLTQISGIHFIGLKKIGIRDVGRFLKSTYCDNCLVSDFEASSAEYVFQVINWLSE